MNIISRDTFLARFAPAGIAFDTRYEPPQTLTITGVPDYKVTFQLPPYPKGLSPWITALLDALDADRLYLVPRDEAWSAAGLKQYLTTTIFGASRVRTPFGNDVLETTPADRDAAESLLLFALLFGGTVSDESSWSPTAPTPSSISTIMTLSTLSSVRPRG